MNKPVWRGRLYRLCLASAPVLTLAGCGLSDRQLSSILQSTIQSGLTSAVNTLISTWLSLPALLLQQAAGT